MGLTSGIRRVRGGGIRVRLSERERDLLRSLPEQMRPALSGSTDVAGVSERLFPPAYDDPEADREFRRLVGDDLRDERMSSLDTFARTLEGGSSSALGWTATLEPAEADAWLSAVNDTRLVLGCLLGITDEHNWEAGPDASDSGGAVLYYLGWLQEQLVEALAGGLPDA